MDTLAEAYINELAFLIPLKQAVSIVNNRIHDRLSWIAIDKLKGRHPDLNFSYRGAGAGGMDIQGFASDGGLKLIAEVKSTHTSETVALRPPQKAAIERDLERLVNAVGPTYRYLVVISQQTKEAVLRQIQPEVRFPGVVVIDAIGFVIAPEVPEEED